MATFVGAFGVPHTPIFAQAVNREGPDSETGRLFAKVREALADARPDVLIVFDTDHLNTFFLDNLPTLAVGVAERFSGPNDEPPELPVRSIPSDPALARHILAHAVRAGYDPATVQEFTVDHSIVVPLHFMTPAMDVPVVPIFVNGHVPPLPPAARAFAFGRTIRAAIDSHGSAQRVAVVGSGSFSLEVYGPRIAPGRNFGVPDPAWAARVHEHMARGTFDALVAEATPERLQGAGNVAGELLDWLAMAGTLGRNRAADWIAAQERFGHSYAIWQEGA